ncbi:alpha-1,2-fucosyltransferase [Nitrobacter sp. JJSN]|uniref:alpha-1,2-fucosyltransferase n=1 Tax=Nitrobacter sp. JJSN TaxID=3453033 RepID=UPI003F75B8D6
MITVSILGGLGNQMFQYAAAKALANRIGTGVVLDCSAFEGYKLRSFMLDRLQIPECDLVNGGDQIGTPATRGYTGLLWRGRVNRLLARVGMKPMAVADGTYVEPYFHFDPAFIELKKPISLFGYFQSERYFENIAGDVRRYFSPREPLGSASQAIADAMDRVEISVSVHIRRGDYVAFAETARVHGALSVDYYRKAIGLIEQRAKTKITIFVFSDDAEAAADLLRFHSGETVEVRGDPDRPWEDMALMARCHHHVIANSSFSWWGAWLNPAPEKIVVAPRAWFSSEELRRRNTCDLYPSGWILV